MDEKEFKKVFEEAKKETYGYVEDKWLRISRILKDKLSPFGKHIKATSLKGFFVKLKLFLLCYSFNCFFKLNDKLKNLVFN